MQHAAIRARQRLGLALSRDDLLGIADKIRRGVAIPMRPGHDGRQRYCVTWEAKAFRAVFDPRLEDPCSVITIFPMPKHDSEIWRTNLKPSRREVEEAEAD